MYRCILTSIAAVFSLSLCVSAQEQKAAPANATQGKELVMSMACYQCHGTVGQGEAAYGPRIYRTELAFDAFLAVLRHPPHEMPPYVEAVLSTEDAAKIYAYLQSLPAPPAVKDLRLLDQ